MKTLLLLCLGFGGLDGTFATGVNVPLVLARDLDEFTSRSNGVGNYIAAGLGYGTSAQLAATSTKVTTSPAPVLSTSQRHGHGNSSTTRQSTTDAYTWSATPSVDTSHGSHSETTTSLFPFISDEAQDGAGFPSPSTFTDGSSLSMPADSTDKSSRTVTASYSTSHISVMGHAPDTMLASRPYSTFNSTARHISGTSMSQQTMDPGRHSANISVAHPTSALTSVSPTGTEHHAGNATSIHSSQHWPLPSANTSGTRVYSTGIAQNATNTTASIPRTGTGYSYAQACNKASVSWSARWMEEQILPGSIVAPTATQEVADAEVYTPCDGIPRMRANATTVISTTSTAWNINPPITLSGAPSQPNCTIAPSDCSQLLSSYSTAHGIPSSVSIGRIHGYMNYISDDWPRCTTNTVPVSQPGADCAIIGHDVQLLYWPQMWADSNGTENCDGSRESRASLTLGPTIPGQPNTMVSGTHTFTSPTVYIKYGTLFAQDYGDAPVGPTLYDGFIPVESTLVSTKVPYFWTYIPWEGPGGLMEIARSTGIINAKMEHGYTGMNLNFADEHVPLTYPDLAHPLSGVPYYQMRVKLALYDLACWEGGCPTMMPWAYRPQLAIPDVARSLAPEWSSCSLPWGGMDDPPKALVPTTAMVMPTLPVAETTTTPAEPAPAYTSPAQQTSNGNGAGGGTPRTSVNGAAQPSPPPYADGKPTSKKHDAAGIVASLLGGAGDGHTSQVNEPTTYDLNSNGSGGGHAAGIVASVLGSAEDEHASQQQQSNTNDPSSNGGSGDNAGSAHNANSNNNPSGVHPADDGPNTSSTGPDQGQSSSYGEDSASNDPEDSDPASITLGSNVLPVHPAGNGGNDLVVGSRTLEAGGSAVVVDGHTASMRADGQLVVDGTPASIRAGNEGLYAPTAARVTLGTHVLTQHYVGPTGGPLVLGDKTLREGGTAATIDGHVVSLGSHGTLMIDGSAIHQFNEPTTVPFSDLTESIAQLESQDRTAFAWRTTLARGRAAAVIGGQTVAYGARPKTIDHTVMSLGSDGLVMQAVESTVAFSASSALITAGPNVLTASKTTLAGRETVAVIGTQTMRLDGRIHTINGDLYSLGPKGLIEMDGASTADFQSSATLLTIDGHTMLARYQVLNNGETVVLVDGRTLHVGNPARTIDGARMSLGSQGIVIGAPDGAATTGSASDQASVVNTDVATQDAHTTEEIGLSNSASARSMSLAAIGLTMSLLIALLM